MVKKKKRIHTKIINKREHTNVCGVPSGISNGGTYRDEPDIASFLMELQG